ncbi:DUF2897 family protein [Psychrobium sp. nBUS_13]
MIWIILIIAVVLGIVLSQFALIKASNKVKMPPPKESTYDDKWDEDEEKW